MSAPSSEAGCQSIGAPGAKSRLLPSGGRRQPESAVARHLPGMPGLFSPSGKRDCFRSAINAAARSPPRSVARVSLTPSSLLVDEKHRKRPELVIGEVLEGRHD